MAIKSWKLVMLSAVVGACIVGINTAPVFAQAGAAPLTAPPPAAH
jgi:hypothetical protein